MSWFWFYVAALMLLWNVFLMRCNHDQAQTIWLLRRRLHQQGLNFLSALIGSDR